jgi:hypothetical protein
MSERASQPRLSLYDRDFFAWSQEQGRLLKARSAAGLDWNNLAEEIEGLGRSDRREIRSRMGIILQHLLKWQFQPAARSGSWAASLLEQRSRLEELLEESPSLKSYPAEIIDKEYPLARQSAAGDTALPIETFPSECPYSVQEVLDPSFLPDAKS